jgi:serine protease SohB
VSRVMYFVIEYLLFAAKALTVLGLCLLPLVVALMLVRGARRQGPQERLTIERLNDKLLDNQLQMESMLSSAKAFKQRLKAVKQTRKAEENRATPSENRLFLCEFAGDLRADAVSSLREEISAILSVANSSDEVAVVLESPGGTIHGYGLAASQLRRVRDRGIRLTVVVDKVAASGGYMMACVADQICAAPFAIIGSIGVVAQVPNFNRLLRKHDIDFELVTAGKYKRTLTMFGENTVAGREKFQAEIDDAHALFKDFVGTHRPQLDIEKIATGEYWFGTRALELGLVDRLTTSDEYISNAAQDRNVYRVRVEHPKALLARLLAPVQTLVREQLQRPTP